MKKIATIIIMILTAASMCSCTVKVNEYENDATFGVAVQDFEVPEPTPSKTVKGSDFGILPSNGDNLAAFESAVTYLKDNPGTTLVLDKGIYKINCTHYICLRDVENCVIEGNGSELLFAGDFYFMMQNCTGIKWHNFIVDRDYDKSDPLGTLVKCVGVASDGRITVETPYTDNAEQLTTLDWKAIIGFDTEKRDFSVFTDVYYPSVTDFVYEGENRVSFKASFTMAEGTTYLVRHVVYANAVFYLAGNDKNITVDGITFYGVKGFCVVAQNNNEGLRLNQLIAKPREGKEYITPMVFTADIVHIVDGIYNFLMENCDLGYSGDDCLNLHDNVGLVSKISGNTVTYTSSSPRFNVGEKAAFYDNYDFEFGADAATVLACETLETYKYTVTLDGIPEGVKGGSVIYNTAYNSHGYIIRNNKFRNCRARALLLQIDGGLVENNYFETTTMDALRVTLDYGGPWYESTGSDGVIIRNNTFDNCGLWGFSSIKLLVVSGVSGYPFKHIVITDNTIRHSNSYSVYVDRCENSAVCGNIIEQSKNNCGGFYVGKYNGLFIENNSWLADGTEPTQLIQYLDRRLNPKKGKVLNNLVK